MKSHEFNKIRAMRKGYGFTQKYMAENLAYPSLRIRTRNRAVCDFRTGRR